MPRRGGPDDVPSGRRRAGPTPPEGEASEIDESETPVETREVLAANQAFYDAFEAADLDAMSAVWEHGDDVACTHPGWATLRGWGKVVASWYALFRNPQRLQFILTEPAVRHQGDVAWVVLDENLLDGAAAQTVSALNIFVRGADGWRMVAHHGSPVMSS